MKIFVLTFLILVFVLSPIALLHYKRYINASEGETMALCASGILICIVCGVLFVELTDRWKK